MVDCLLCLDSALAEIAFDQDPELPIDQEEIGDLAEEECKIESLTLQRPDLWLQFMVANFAVSNKLPLQQTSALLKLQKLIVSSVIEKKMTVKDFESVPLTARAAFRNLGIWETKSEFDVYACCSNHHLVKVEDFFDDKNELIRPVECQDSTFGPKNSSPREMCLQPLLKEVTSSTGGKFYHPQKVAPFRGIIRGLRHLFKQKWFVDGLAHWEQLPDISPAMSDVYTGRRWKRWLPWLRSNPLNVLLMMSIDW